MKYTDGTKLTMGLGYYKFYWHGITLYFCVRPLRTCATVLVLEKQNLAYMADMGLSEKCEIIKNDVTYIPSAVNGIRVYPWYNISLTNWQEDTQASLLWRLVSNFVKNSVSGNQIGDNWENLNASTFITNASNEYLYQEIGGYDAYNQTKVINNSGNLVFNLKVDNGIGDDQYQIIFSVKNYATVRE